MDDRYLHERLHAIIASTLDIKDQLAEGVSEDDLEHNRWKKRYHGDDWADYKACRPLVFNVFRPQVDAVVGAIFHAMSQAEMTEVEREQLKQKHQLIALMASKQLSHSLSDTLPSLPPST